MDLKKKIISFLTDKKVEDVNDQLEEEWLNDAGVVKLKHCTLGVRDPRVDREALESIEEAFFQDGPLDPAHVQLSRFTELPDQQLIETVCASLKTQLQAVSRKISDLVLDNQATYASELERVATLQRDLHTALITCLDSRRNMREGKETFTTAGLKLLANHRKRGLLKRLLSSLHTIKTLQRTDNKLKELLKEENFPGAINLSLEYEKAASTYKHYHCISELSSKLHDNSEMVDEALDVALSRTCLSFNHHLYTRIQQAYRLLGKSQVAADQLHMHYISCVHVTSFNMVLSYVEMCSGAGEGVYQKKQFQDLCACLKPEVYVRCLVELCGVLWRVVCSYRHSTHWHTNHDNEEAFFERDSSSNKHNEHNDENNNSIVNNDVNNVNTDINNNNNKTFVNGNNNDNITTTTTTANTKNINSNDNNNNSKNNNKNNNSNNNSKNNNINSSSNDLQQLDLSSIHYVRNKLEVGKCKLWTEIQQKVKTYLLSHDLSHFQYEEFMRVLDVINKLIRIGADFCGSGSEGLEEAVVKQSSCYFRTYHQARVDEMKAFVENEGWVLCPVKTSFHLTRLQEFKFLKHKQSSSGPLQPSLFVTYASDQNPFLCAPDDDTTPEGKGQDHSNKRHTNNHHHQHSKDGFEEEDGGDDDDDDDDVEESLKGDFVDEECRNGDDDDASGAGYPWKLTKAVQRQSSVVATRSTPLLTNLTLYVCKLFGRYMHMMSSLECISYDVIKSMTQLIDYYFYAVYETFGGEKEQQHHNVSSKFKGVVERVRNSMASHPPPLFPIHHPSPVFPTHQPLPTTSNHNNKELDTNCNNSSTIDGTRRSTDTHRRTASNTGSKTSFSALKALVVATESLLFLVAQFRSLETLLYEAIPPQQRGLLDQYFLQTLSVVGEVRSVVYSVFVRQHLCTSKVLSLMTSVMWDIDDIMSQHSPYVDVLLKDVGSFKASLVDFSSSFPLPNQALECLWKEVSLLCCETLLEGISACKRCSNEGRALMMLDFQQFLLKFHKLSSLRPVPGQAMVEGYIKAFYLPETEIEKWIVSSPEYNSRQLSGLIQCLTGLSRKTRHKLLTLLEEDKYRK